METVLEWVKVIGPILVGLAGVLWSMAKWAKNVQDDLIDELRAQIKARDKVLAQKDRLLQDRNDEMIQVINSQGVVLSTISETISTDGKKTRDTVRIHTLRVIESVPGATPKEVIDDGQ